jgi:hypothetical protein
MCDSAMSPKIGCSKYASFLLRVSLAYCERGFHESPVWRTDIDLEHIQTGKRWTYASWDDLFDFFCREGDGLEQLKWLETYPDE